MHAFRGNGRDWNTVPLPRLLWDFQYTSKFQFVKKLERKNHEAEIASHVCHWLKYSVRNVHKSYCKKNTSHVTWFNIVHRKSLNYNICCAILKTKRHFLCNQWRHEMHNTYICLLWYQTFSLSENQIVIYHLPYMHNAHDNMHNKHLVFKCSF